MIKTLGVDIGITSIGWALIESEAKEDGVAIKRIIDSGVRIFTEAENPKDKSSLALPRRNARGMRRRIQRRRSRVMNVKNFLADSLRIPIKSMLASDNHSSIFDTSRDFISPWTLRIDALDRLLSNDELARVILHIAKRRGYDDITYGAIEIKDDAGQKSEENQKIGKAIKENKRLLEEKGYRTIGEMMVKEYFMQTRSESPGEWDNVRNRQSKDKKPSYKRCVGRSELRHELEQILEAQKRLGNTTITAEFIAQLLGDSNAKDKAKREGLIFFQRPLKGFGDKIGDCQHMRGNGQNPKRACKNAPSAEEFVARTQLMNFLKNYTQKTGDMSFNTAEVIEKCLEEARKTKTGLTYSKLKKILSFSQEWAFEEFENEKKAFITLEGTVRLNEALGDIDTKIKDEVACILGVDKDWGVLRGKLEKIGLSQEQIAKLQEAGLSFSKHINLSLEALYHLLPLMRECKRYDEAVAILEGKGIFHKREAQIKDRLPSLSELAKEDSYFDVSNPVVNRALSEFRKVVNALIEKHGKFHYFNIELTREVIKSKEQRKKIKDQQDKNQALNKTAEKSLQEWGLENNGANRLKWKLWFQQNECCIYSGKKITIDDFRCDNLEVDHVFPFHRSLDDSQSNKVLCFERENQSKGGKSPYEYLGEERWQEYVARVDASKFEKTKKKKITHKECRERSSEEFLERNFVDTGYIGKLVKKYVEMNLGFLEVPDPITDKNPIRVISGSLTSTLRHWWGIGTKDRNHHLHHAQDAIILACIRRNIIKTYADFLKKEEAHENKQREKLELLDEKANGKTKRVMRRPMEHFRNRVEESIRKITVSHRVSRKVTGALHEDTIRTKEHYYEAYGGEKGVQKAIELGKIRQINEGIVDNGGMKRVDVFRSRDKGNFYAVPIYTFDFALGKLPNRAIVQGKGKDGVIKDWIEMDERYEFCFSLFKNDCACIQTKEMQNPVLAIYKGTNSKNGAMSFEHLSKYDVFGEDEKAFFAARNGKRTFKVEGVGIQRLRFFSKVSLSPLGEVKPCRLPYKPSKRQDIKLKSSPKHV